MEFPELGQHCYQKECQRLDFLPMKCDACTQIFCNDHIHYATHSCAESYKKDNQVPVCPLCNKPIPLKKGEVPDVVVGRHIDSDCQSDPAKERRKVYTNKCSKKGCKVKEMVPVKCDRCHLNYCLKHRFEDDHNCQGFQGTGQSITKSGAAAVSRLQGPSGGKTASKPSNPAPQQRKNTSNNPGFWRELDRERRERQQQPSQQVTAAQAGLSNEEALARAIQESLRETQQPSNSTAPNQTLTQEEEDLLLAQAISASEEESRRQAARQNQQPSQEQSKKGCRVS